MEHYYTQKPTIQSDEKTYQFTFSNQLLTFITDNGVFSKSTLDFGSRTLLETLIPLTIIEGDILDVGCGYGPMGIIASLVCQRHVDMVDVNERAVALANRNAQLNHAQATAFLSSAYDNVSKTDYALIITNPPIRAGKKVVHHILEHSYNHLKVGGRLVVVIQKKQGAPSAKQKIEDIFGHVEELERQKGYWILSAVKCDRQKQ